MFDLFAKAANPDNIYVGVVQQNKENEEDCFDKCSECSKRKLSGHIRVKNFSYMEAKGPTFARYHASKLWQGEEWYLQIDSHLKFEKDWDIVLIEQMRMAGDNAVVGGYPPTDEQMESSRKTSYGETIISCSNGLNEDGMPNIGSQVVDGRSDRSPIPVMFMSAGLMCMPGKAIADVPYDPYISYAFFGEEILHSARLWTSGYNLYAIGRPIATHHYYREGKPRYTTDHPESTECRLHAVQRIKYILGLAKADSVHPDYMLDIDAYGLGKKRSIDAFWEKSGFHPKEGRSNRVCEVTI